MGFIQPAVSLLVFPAVQPTRTIDASLRLLADPLAAVLASDLPLDHLVVSDPFVHLCDDEQTQSDEEEAQDLVNKVAVRPNHGAVVQSLFDGIVA